MNQQFFCSPLFLTTWKYFAFLVYLLCCAVVCNIYSSPLYYSAFPFLYFPSSKIRQKWEDCNYGYGLRDLFALTKFVLAYLMRSGQHARRRGKSVGTTPRPSATWLSRPPDVELKPFKTPAEHFYAWLFIICNGPLLSYSTLLLASSLHLIEDQFNVIVQVVK